MCRYRFGVVVAVVLGIVVPIGCGEVRAQSDASSPFSLGASPAPVTGAVSAPITGAQPAPVQYPIVSPLQMIGANSSGLGGGGQSNMFNNPWAAPMLYGTMYGMGANPTGSSSTQTGAMLNPMGLSSNQMGMMMLASTPGMMGFGSGQLSGVRPGAGPQGTASQRSGAQARGSASQPGGLAARYFNRTTKTSRIPQSYFNRQTRYFPASGR